MSVRARIRAGDPDAFGALYDDNARAVYNHAFRLTGDWSTAEDVMALTFLEAWRLRGGVDVEGGSLRPWLLGIATNTARNTRRAARRHEAAVGRLPRGGAVPDFAEELVGRIDDTEQLRTVRAVVGGLRRAEREVLALCVWSGLDYAAAAQALGIPVGTVRSRLARARAKLARLVGPAATEVRNPRRDRGQVEGGRTSAARPTQEETR
ncbi:RNA polymerase sigma factor [Streptomyces yaizuensis]|uniref:RNA polymerase sigma factor n=2 Tax=Streptomyces yaizuensis TaxID=2989713 RepID=A0ABQ5PAG9_9ACTN|nr:RNA polymerase sigma factor [Streptomyces sp. YSPA8]